MGDKIYIEMDENVQMLNHIRDNLEFAHCKIALGFEGPRGYLPELLFEVSNETLRDLEKAIDGVDKLIEAYDVD